MIIFNYIIAGLIGIIIYQIVAMVVYVATNEDDNIMSIMGMLVPYGIWCCIVPIIRKVYLLWCKKNLKGYRFCWRKEDGTIDGDLHTFYATDKMVKSFSQDEKNCYFIKMVSTGKSFKSWPYKDDIYKGQSHFRGWDMSKFKKLEDEK